MPAHVPAAADRTDRLHLGCGRDIKRGFVNVDLVDAPGVDVVHDLDSCPWPFEDSTFELIICNPVLEHLADFHAAVTEIHRIGRPGCIVSIRAPYFFSTKYCGDLSHRIPFSYRTFDNYTPPRRITFYNRWRLQHATNFGGGFLFKTLDKRYVFDTNPLIRWIGCFHNLAPMFYERFMPSFLPPMEVAFTLEVVK